MCSSDLTSVMADDSYKILNNSALNKVNGYPVLYFYNISNLKIHNIDANYGIAPITIGGNPYSGNKIGRASCRERV